MRNYHRNHHDWENLEESRHISLTLYQAVNAAGMHLSHAAKELGVSEWLLYKWTDCDSANNNFPLYLLRRFTRRISDELIKVVAKRCGYLLVPEPRINCNKVEDEALELICRELKENTEALEKFKDAISDRKVTPREMRTLEREIDGAISSLLLLREYAKALSIVPDKPRLEVVDE
jgi:hypothetical protein